MYKALNSDGSRQTVILYGLSGIGKSLLSVKYTKWHKDNCLFQHWVGVSHETKWLNHKSSSGISACREFT